MSRPKKKIAYVSGTRADFGLVALVLHEIEKSSKLSLNVYATGIHLMSEFGETVKEVVKEFPGAERLDVVFSGDGRAAAAKFIGELIPKMIMAFENDRPDFILILGDRPEALASAIVGLYLGIPTAHIHGGDKSFTVDEVARHAITKLAHIHFPATEEAGDRVVKMGEEPWRVHVVGAPGLDAILNEKLPSREELFKFIGVDPKEKTLLVTMHPVSEEYESAGRQMEEVIAAVKSFNLPVVVSYPHADAGGRKIIEVIEREKDNPLFCVFPNLPHPQFLSMEREAAVWIGNSSGAMIESSSFKTPVVDVGIRQSGRQHGNNVIRVPCQRKEIERAIRESLDEKYIQKMSAITNPWGDGKAGMRIVAALEDLEITPELLIKQITY